MNNIKKTKITAFKVNFKIDAGYFFLKKKFRFKRVSK